MELKTSELSAEVKKELDSRLQYIEEGIPELCSWDEVKTHIKNIRN